MKVKCVEEWHYVEKTKIKDWYHSCDKPSLNDLTNPNLPPYILTLKVLRVEKGKEDWELEIMSERKIDLVNPKSSYSIGFAGVTWVYNYDNGVMINNRELKL
jgi:hypothetical protein